MNHRSALRCWLFTLALLALVPRLCLANSLWFLSADGKKAVEIETHGEEMEISCKAVDENRYAIAGSLLMEKMNINRSRAEPLVMWSPDSRSVVLILAYPRGSDLRVYRFNNNTPVAVDTSSIDNACPDLGKRMAATNKTEPNAGQINVLSEHVVWDKYGRLTVQHDGMDIAGGSYLVTMEFDPETAETSHVKVQVNGVDQKLPAAARSAPEKAVPTAPPAKTGFWRIFKH